MDELEIPKTSLGAIIHTNIDRPAVPSLSHIKLGAFTMDMLFAPSSLLIVLGIGAALAYLIKHLAHAGRNGRPLPPGPKGLPLVGNLNDLPKPGMLECHHWLQHKDVYGPISSITVLGQTFVIISDAQLALELLRDRSASHSARPHMVFSSDM